MAVNSTSHSPRAAERVSVREPGGPRGMTRDEVTPYVNSFCISTPHRCVCSTALMMPNEAGWPSALTCPQTLASTPGPAERCKEGSEVGVVHRDPTMCLGQDSAIQDTHEGLRSTAYCEPHWRKGPKCKSLQSQARSRAMPIPAQSFAWKRKQQRRAPATVASNEEANFQGPGSESQDSPRLPGREQRRRVAGEGGRW